MTSLSHSAFVSFLSVLSVFSLTNFSLPRNTSLSINLSLLSLLYLTPSSLLSLLYLTPSSPYYTSLPSPSSPYYTSLPPLPTIPHSLLPPPSSPYYTSLPPPSSPYYTSLPPLPTIPHSLLSLLYLTPSSFPVTRRMYVCMYTHSIVQRSLVHNLP